MSYPEEQNRAGEYLRMALRYITRYSLPANPVNYTVWYEYVSGKNMKLKKVLDRSLEKAIPMDRARIEALYQKYVSDGDRLVIGKLLTKVSLMLKEITSHISETQGDLAGSGQRMESLAEEMSGTADMDRARGLVDQMIEEARVLVKSGKRLQNRMSVSSEDLKQLRSELEKSQQEAQTDTLTRLVNRRGLEKQMELERIRARQNDAPFSIILLDIDHFKRVNDQFGHLVGDSLLKGLAALLAAHLRKKDLAARFGGEEFLILLPETNIDGAIAVCEKIRKTLEKKEWKIKESGEVMGKITVSMGVALYRLNESEKTLIGRADKALYMAKENGRDRVFSELDLETVEPVA